jgi:sulfate adenylyltransferase subunit 1
VLTQTKRHSYIVALLGIKNIVVAINKMDLIDFSQERFEAIKKEYEKIILKLPHHNDIHFDYIPVSALNGDNIISNSTNMPWYQDKSLMSLLDTTKILTKTRINHNFRFMVQYVNRPNLDFRGFCGTISSGKIAVGESVTVLPSKKTSKVKEIILPTIQNNAPIKEASLDMAITLTLEDEIDINRGDLIVNSDSLPQMSNKFSVMVVWMAEEPMKLHNSYVIKRGTTVLNGIASEIVYAKNINTFEEYSVQELQLNDIAKCMFTLDRNIAFDSYNTNRNTGSFIIIDKYTNETVGAGMIVSSIIKANEESKRVYTKEDIELNAFIREKYPEWNCKSIYE